MLQLHHLTDALAKHSENTLKDLRTCLILLQILCPELAQKLAKLLT